MSGDAERLQAIQNLERAIAAKEPPRREAKARLDADRQAVRDQRTSLKAVDDRLARIATETLRRSSGVYLNGDSLDRGTLILGNEAVRFSGWGGKAVIRLASISQIEIGRSYLPVRAGVPLLSRFWPGPARQAGTLLLRLREGSPFNGELAVIADLDEPNVWRNQIVDQQSRQPEVESRRSEYQRERVRAQAALDQATATMSESQAALDLVEREIGALRDQRDKLQAQQREINAAREREVRQAKARGRKR